MMVHWAVWVSVPGGRFKVMTGCMQWPGDLTEHPEQVTCKRCKALPSFRAAAMSSGCLFEPTRYPFRAHYRGEK